MSKSFSYASQHYFPDDSYWSKGAIVRVKKIIKLIGRDKKVLDVGCYDGFVGEIIKKKNNDVYGLDASMNCVEAAQKKGIKAHIGDLEKEFPFESNFFDTVVAGEIIEHILDTNFFIDEIKRVLKPDGELIITTPNVASLARRIMLLLGMNPYFEASLGFPKEATAGHIRFFTKKLLKDFLEHKGMKTISFESDTVNFANTLNLKILADLFPTLGRGLIFKFKNLKDAKIN